ncbi:MAG: hypothetical protein JF595_07625 [Sphingomonadales bacterium]|nr:hypothetical protein [Sphingomonadales bacterium]
MTIRKFALFLALAGLAPPATAQSVTDDLRCLLLSNAYAKLPSAAGPAKQIAIQNVVFYAGRLDGRADPRTLASAVRANVGPIEPRAAATQVMACAERVKRSIEALQANVRAALPPARPAPGK